MIENFAIANNAYCFISDLDSDEDVGEEEEEVIAFYTHGVSLM